ncbi:MAG: anthranilate synthase component I [Microcystaceae cyanobacterium]
MPVLTPWYWQSFPLGGRTGSQIFTQFFAQDRIATLLESPYPPSTDYPYLCRYSICAGKPRYHQGKPQLWTPPVGQIFPFLKALTPELSPENHTSQRMTADIPDHLPFQGGWLGWLGYDAAWEIERLPTLKADVLPFPVAYWYEPENFAVLDHQEQILWLASSSPAPPFPLSPSPPSPSSSFPSSLHFQTAQTDYEAMVLKAKNYIQKGDIFQANLSLRFTTETPQGSWQVYQTLQRINPSPFASYWRSPWGEVVSCSPERLVQLVGRQAQTRPIAGTRPRGKSPLEETQFGQDLRQNLKEQAEHIMLVDLERNDLGRVCEWGSVKVNELLVLERYSHVMHLVSNVIGTLKPNYQAADLIQALFPGGTITGCPKVRCMEIIEELEPVRRSLFYGSCGYLDHRGNLDLNILIRTLLFTQNQVIGQVGAGIVADSNPHQEWLESLQKAQAQLAALNYSG